MFAVIYRWKLVPGREALFEEGWRAGTEAIAKEFGGWGSRLHRGEDGIAVAYAQWPDRATWCCVARSETGLVADRLAVGGLG
jgi:hypothetical protein